MYVFGYASGVGELEVPRWEIYWAVIIGLSGIVFILSRLYSAKKYSEWIVVSVCFTSLWILTSYYIGRAVVNNLTALLPLIFYIFIVILLVLKDSTFIRFRLLLYAVFMPWVVVGVIGGIGNPQFINTLKGLKFAENIDSKSYEPADRELSGILRSLKVTEKTRMAYWDLYESPVVYDKSGKYMDPIAGIPMPLVLLEKPLVSKGMRDVIVERFFDNLNESVFLIHRKKNDIARFSVWTSFFKQNYILEKKEIVSMRYEVFLIRHK
jgi:hypothetical protein